MRQKHRMRYTLFFSFTNWVLQLQDDLGLEIENLEAIQHQVEKRHEKILRVSQLQRQIHKALEELHHMMQQKELIQGSHNQRNFHFKEHNYDASLSDDSSPLATELQATSWPPHYRPPQLPTYDGMLDPK